ncbi:hypothetical protein FRC12_000690 [Ceratobasidium sp. 428]|nr:hypothetical protein FRC12_000690 [Ceratobasidium sp. 428]
MAASRVALPDIKGPGSSAIVAINIESSDNESDREQSKSSPKAECEHAHMRVPAPPPTHEGHNAGRLPPLPRHGYVVNAAGHVRAFLLPYPYPRRPPPRSGVLPELPELPEIPPACGTNKRDLPPPPPSHPPPRPDLARELVRPGLRRLVPLTARPLTPGPYLERIRSKQRPAGTVPTAAHDASIPQPAPAPAPAIGPTPGPIVIEELRRVTYVAWGLPDAIAGPGLLLRNEPVAVTVSRYE